MFYVIVKPEHVNSRMAAIGGKVVAHLPNYMEIFATKPMLKDEAFQVFAIDPLESEVNIQATDGKKHYFLWLGDKGSRSRPQDLVSVPIFNAALNPVEAIPFSDYPPVIKLAAVLMSSEPQVLTAAPGITPALSQQLKAWAEATLNEHMSKG